MHTVRGAIAFPSEGTPRKGIKQELEKREKVGYLLEVFPIIFV